MQSLNVYLTEPIIRKVKEHAHSTGVSNSAIIKIALHQYFSQTTEAQEVISSSMRNP